MQQELLAILADFVLAFVIASGFAILFRTPRNVIWVAGLLGGVGHSLRFFLHNHVGIGIIFATLIGAIIIGLAGLNIAHKVHTPPVVFTVPACISMLPGLFAYRTMLGLIKLTDEVKVKENPQILQDTFHNFVLTSSLLFCLAIGITVGALLFRQKSAKHITFKIKSRTK
jgi:uncharacterized membrane protein YjjB (DUF3815 family)